MWDDWQEDESEGYKSLFDESRFNSLEEVLQHDQKEHGFTLRQYRAQVCALLLPILPPAKWVLQAIGHPC